MSHRDTLGRVVREAWVRWAKTQPNPKASWLVPYDDLSESDKEADRQIAESVFDHIWDVLNHHRLAFIETNPDSKGPAFRAFQEACFAVLSMRHPGPPPIGLAALESFEKGE